VFNDADAFLEINEATTAVGTTVIKQYSRVSDGAGIRDSIRIELAGYHRSTPVNVSFEVDPSGTAIAGTHYNMITTETSLTIPANSSYAYVYFEVLDDNIEPQASWDLKFRLTSGDLPLHPTYSAVTRRIQTLCAYSRDNFLGTYDADEPGYGHYDVTFTADPDDENTIVNGNFWDSGVSVKYVLTSSGTVTIPLQEFTTQGILCTVVGTTAGTIDLCTYQIVAPYKVNRKSDNFQFDDNTHTFVKK
jgi:hypothetical protein